MIEAWLRLSLTMRSVSPVMVGMTPVLAVNPDWNVRTAGVPLNSASSASRASCIDIVPAIVRTAPDPTPKSRTAARAASRSRRVVGQAEVVVRGQADQPLVVDRDDRALGRRHDPQRAVEVAFAERGDLVVEERERICVAWSSVVVPGWRDRIVVMSAGPVHHHFAGGPGTCGREGCLVVAIVEAMRDDGADVEPRLEHHRHLVPGLVHLPAVDAVEASAGRTRRG